MTASNANAIPKPQGLLLDAMGTLIGLRHSVGSTYAAFAAEHGVIVDADAINAVFPNLFKAAPPLAFPGLSGSALLEAEQTWWIDLITTCLETCGVRDPLPPALGPALFQHFAGPEPWQVYADVAEHLQRWRAAGLKLAVVSNFDQRLGPLLEHLHLAPLLDAVVVSTQVGAAKPDPRPFARALELLNLPPAAAWHIGDSPEDEAGAQAAGLRCLLIRRPRPAGTPGGVSP
jgi:putative hydrolase of the HAD superfamily